MHELSIVQNFVKTTDDFAASKGIDHVKFVTLTIGANTGVIPKYVRMYYDEVAANTRLDHSELRIEEIPTECFCRNCGETYTPQRARGGHGLDAHCPYCHDEDYDIIAGDELMIKEIGYE